MANVKVDNQWQTILFAVLGIYLIKKVFDLFNAQNASDENPDNDLTVDDIKKKTEEADEYQNYVKAGVYRSYSYETYKSIADKLFKYMDGMGTKTEEIQELLTNYVKNDVDWICIWNAFGWRKPYWASYGFAKGGNLRTWLKGDLSEDEIKEINDNWKSKGKITKRI